MMFHKQDDTGFKELQDGVRLKALVYGEKTLLAEFRLEKGKALPRHSHPHEQTGYLVEGRIRLTIGEASFDAEPGDSWNIPSQVEHDVEVLEDTVVIEVFSPAREDYLP